jgi:hypothetical protein
MWVITSFDANFRSDFWVFMHLLLEDRTAERTFSRRSRRRILPKEGFRHPKV